MTLDLSRIQADLAAVKLYDTGYLGLLSSQGRWLAHPRAGALEALGLAMTFVALQGVFGLSWRLFFGHGQGAGIVMQIQLALGAISLAALELRRARRGHRR